MKSLISQRMIYLNLFECVINNRNIFAIFSRNIRSTKFNLKIGSKFSRNFYFFYFFFSIELTFRTRKCRRKFKEGKQNLKKNRISNDRYKKWNRV